MTSIRYQVGGALLQDVSSYVTRDSDRQLFEALKAGEFCYVLNSRQMGKSSLMVRTLAQLQESGWKGIILDFSAKDTQSDQPSFWYNGIVNQLNNHFKLLDLGNFRTWLKERDFISPVERLGEFIETVLLPGIIEPIIIFVDEIDSTLGLPFTDDFFALIRACYNRRAEKSDYKRLTFALLGVAAPSELIGDTKRTPFNIGKSIDLSGFTLAEAQLLAAGLAEKSENPQAVLKAILYWTGGQPFLSQRLCQLVADSTIHLVAGHEDSMIEELVRSRLIENWESQDQQSHLKTIRDRVIQNEQKAGYLLELYRQTRQAGSLSVQNRPEEQELQLSGLVVKREGNLQVYNPIYGEVFNESWIDGELAKLRPYAENFRAWIASGSKDESRLLRGQALQDAIQWRSDKNLSFQDEQFLGASYQLKINEEISVAQQEAELRLEKKRREETEKANQILESALKQRMKWGWVLGIILAITTPILLLRFSGILQGWEWTTYDFYMRMRPTEVPDRRIGIVEIDENDIKNLTGPIIPDGVLADLLLKLKAMKPRAIGLLVYRDLPIEPGHDKLLKVFRTTPNLIGIQKVVGEDRVAASPILKILGQIGANDLMIDADNRIRRGLLYLNDGKENVYGFGLLLAAHYLEKEGISPKVVAGTQNLQIGKAVFAPFESNDGGYIQADAGGFQVLINYRGGNKYFETVSMTDILKKNGVPADWGRDRIILIGQVGKIFKDGFFTPYSRVFGLSQNIPTVEIHANIASQIISAAIDGRPLIRSFPDSLEWLWILFWAGIGGTVSWRFLSPIVIAISILLLSGGLLLGCYLVFLIGWWLPIVPSLLALWVAAVSILVVTNRQRDSFLVNLTLTELLKVRQDSPDAVRRIAIEYLKQSAKNDNQKYIEENLED